MKQKTTRKQGAPSRCCHRTIPTVSASSLTTTAWWPMPACSCRPPLHSTWGLRELVGHHLDLGCAPGRANTGDKLLTLVASALAGGDFIDDADALRAGGTVGVLGCVVKAPSTLGTFLRSFRWGACPSTRPGEPPVAGTRMGRWGRTRRLAPDHRPGLHHLPDLWTGQRRGARPQLHRRAGLSPTAGQCNHGDAPPPWPVRRSRTWWSLGRWSTALHRVPHQRPRPGTAAPGSPDPTGGRGPTGSCAGKFPGWMAP